MRAWRALGCGLVLGAALLAAGLTRAHAFPDHETPGAGAVLASPPAQVEIHFDRDLEPAFSTLQVTDADGHRVDAADAHVPPGKPDVLVVSLPSDLAPGTYHVTWSVVALDGHRTEGDYHFQVR